MEGHQQFSYFSDLRVVHCRNVDLTTLNIALLGRQPKYCEIPSLFQLALFSVFLISFRYNFRFWTSYFCLFLMCLWVFQGYRRVQAQFLRDVHVHYSVRWPNSCFKKKRKTGTILSGMPRRSSLRCCVGKQIFSYSAFRYTIV